MSAEIVKIQMPLFPPDCQQALIYDRNRKHIETRDLHKRESRMMGSDKKIYATGAWSGRTWSIGARVENQKW